MQDEQQQQQTLSLAPSNSHSSAKIKPIIRQFCREKTLNDRTALRLSKPHVKNLKQMRFDQQATRFTPKNRSLRVFANTLKSQNSLSSLYYQLLSKLQFNTALFSKEFRGLSSLSSLQLEVHEYPNTFTSLQVFLKILASFKNLTHLDVKFIVLDAKRSSAFCNFIKSLVHLRNLTSLSLNIQMYQYARGNEQDLVLTYLNRLTQLRKLTLSFDRIMETGHKNHITILPSALSKLTNLTHISLSPAGRTIQASALLNLFMLFGTMKSLSSINMILAYSNIINENPSEILTECLACLDPSVIRKLNIHIYQNTDTEGLKKFTQALKRFTSLSLLRLNFRGCQGITDENITEISAMVKTLPSLDSLSLFFPPLETEILFDSIVSILPSQQNLKLLTLAFDHLKKIAGCQVQQLFSSLKPSLQFLNIEIHEPKSVVEDSAAYEKFGENLKELIHLKNLSLNFKRNRIIKNAEIESIIDAIKELPRLSSLDLRVGGLESIDESVIEKLAEALRSLPSLSSVHFQLSECKKLKEKEDSLLSLFNVLKEKVNIVDISLWIGYSETNQEQTSKLMKVKDISLFWC